MPDEINKAEGENIGGDSVINISSEKSDQESDLDEGRTVGQMESEKKQKNKVKNLSSVVILLAGLLLGSIFVDVVQFFSGSGYSERALKNAQVFEGGEKTWVAYNDPPVEVKVLGVSDDEAKNCPDCDPTDVLVWLKRFVPTVVAKKVDASSPEGEKMIKDYNLKTVPAFVFDNSIKESEFYGGEAKVLFDEKDGSYVLNAAQLGVPIGKYLETPKVEENDPVLGNKDASLKMVVFSDFQCPYCKMFYETVTKVAKEYGDKIALVYKEFPLDFHPQANNAAMAAMCANEQGKFWEMADILYKNQQTWGETEGKDAFKPYGQQIGVNVAEFNQCLDGDKYKEKIENDVAQAKEYGLSGTPSGFIGDQFVGGVIGEEELKKMIDEELAGNQDNQ